MSTVLRPPPGLWIFVFHSVGCGDTPGIQHDRFEIEPETFARAARWIASRFRVLSCTEALDRLSRGLGRRERLAVVTFDDGYRGVREHAWPVLRDLRMPFTVYVNSTMIDDAELMWRNRIVYLQDRFARDLSAPVRTMLAEAKTTFTFPGTVRALAAIWRHHVDSPEEAALARRIYLGWDDLQEMQRLHPAPVTVGNHTAHHWILSKLPAEVVAAEVDVCRMALDWRFTSHSPFLAVPHGDAHHTSRRVGEIIAAKGYRPLLGTGGWWRPDRGPVERPVASPRVNVSRRRPVALAVLEQWWLATRSAP